MTDQEEEEQVPPDSTEEVVIETDFESVPTPKQVMVTDEELKKLQHEAMEYKDKYLRGLADGENARKRMQKERLELTKYAAENIIIDFLHPIDSLESALNFAQNMSEEVRNWAVGFQMILTEFKDILARNGVVVMNTKGTHFDPHQHEAVEMIETDELEPGIVIEECLRGYKMGDKTIRAARVKVSKAPAKKSEEITEEDK